MSHKKLILVLIGLSQILSGCRKSAEATSPDIWDVKKEIKIQRLLTLGEWGPVVLSQPRSLAIKIAEDAVPVPAGNEGCMCTYLNAPPNIGEEISRLFRTTVVFHDSLEENGLPDAIKDPLRPVIYQTFEKRESYVHMKLSVKLASKEVASFEAKIRPALAFNPEDFGSRKNSNEAGFLGLIWQSFKGALTLQPSLDQSTVFKEVEKFFQDCSSK